jgi:hypothetical protein
VSEEHLGNLVSDAMHGIEGRQRILEDHADLIPADLTDLLGR